MEWNCTHILEHNLCTFAAISCSFGAHMRHDWEHMFAHGSRSWGTPEWDYFIPACVWSARSWKVPGLSPGTLQARMPGLSPDTPAGKVPGLSSGTLQARVPGLTPQPGRCLFCRHLVRVAIVCTRIFVIKTTMWADMCDVCAQKMSVFVHIWACLG